MENKKEPNDLSVAELRALLDRAEPGPWRLGDLDKGRVGIDALHHGDMANAVWQMDDDAIRGRISPSCEANAKLLAQARRSAERLVEAMDRLEVLEVEAAASNGGKASGISRCSRHICMDSPRPREDAGRLSRLPAELSRRSRCRSARYVAGGNEVGSLD